MNVEERIQKKAEKAKGLSVGVEPAYYECASYCSENGCSGHENGWAEFYGDGPDGEIQLDLGKLFDECEPAVVAAFCGVVAAARVALANGIGDGPGARGLEEAVDRFDWATKKEGAK